MKIKVVNQERLNDLDLIMGLDGTTDLVFVGDGEQYEFAPGFWKDYKSGIIKPSYGIDRKQIEWLDSLPIKASKMPLGVVNYKDSDIATICFDYHQFKGYSSLSREDTILLFKVLRQAIANLKELLSNGVYKTDFSVKSIVYRPGEDKPEVGLVGLYGQSIKCEQDASLKEVFEEFGPTLFELMDEILKRQYSGDEYLSKKVILSALLGAPRLLNDIDYPNKLVDTVEEARLFRR